MGSAKEIFLLRFPLSKIFRGAFAGFFFVWDASWTVFFGPDGNFFDRPSGRTVGILVHGTRPGQDGIQWIIRERK